jgi:hypothetical protein
MAATTSTNTGASEAAAEDPLVAQEKSISELEDALAAPVATVKPPAKPSASLANLESLRNRVMGMGGAPQPIPDSDIQPESPSIAEPSPSTDMHAVEQAAHHNDPFLGTVRPMRTFRDDIANVVERRKISLVSAIAAEEDERSRKKTLEDTPKQTSGGLSSGAYFMLGMSTVLFVVGAVVLGGYALFFNETPEVGVPSTSLPTLVFTEMQTQLDITGMNRNATMAALQSEKDRVNMRLGALTAIHPIVQSEGYQLVSAQMLLQTLESRAPQPLVRALAPYFVFGVHEFDGNEPFFIFKTEAYEIAYAGMLEWEPLMSIDLSPLFGRVSLMRSLSPIEESASDTLPGFVAPSSTTPQASTSTSSEETSLAFVGSESAPEVPGAKFTPGRFEDAVIRNKEVRVLKDDSGKIQLIYSFLDPSTIIITTNEYTFIEIQSRYSSRRF